MLSTTAIYGDASTYQILGGVFCRNFNLSLLVKTSVIFVKNIKNCLFLEIYNVNYNELDNIKKILGSISKL